AEHFEPAMKAFGLDFQGIGEALGRTWAVTLWGCAFEDFLTRRFGPGDENPTEVYLRRCGWKEPVTARTYMTALRTSLMSLYEASDIIPGQSLRARNLVRGGDPVVVSERTATRTLKTWDWIAARIVEHNGKMFLAGGLRRWTNASVTTRPAASTSVVCAGLRDSPAPIAERRGSHGGWQGDGCGVGPAANRHRRPPGRSSRVPVSRCGCGFWRCGSSPARRMGSVRSASFRFNRRRSKARRLLFHRLAQQALAVGPAPYNAIVKPPGSSDSQTTRQ